MRKHGKRSGNLKAHAGFAFTAALAFSSVWILGSGEEMETQPRANGMTPARLQKQDVAEGRPYRVSVASWGATEAEITPRERPEVRYRFAGLDLFTQD